MSDTQLDLTAAPDTFEGNTGKAFTAAQLVTMACHGVINTRFVAPDPKPDWFDDLNGKLQVATGCADEWITDLGPRVTSKIPVGVVDFGTIFTPATEQILQIVHAHPDAAGRDNRYVREIRELINQTLLPPLDDSLTKIAEAGDDLKSWGSRIQAAHDGLSSGAVNIQKAQTSLQADIGKMNSAIDALHAEISKENTIIAASAGAIGVGVFALVAGIAFAPVTGGVSLIVSGIGAAGIIGGAITWGIFQHKINQQFDQIAKDQQRMQADKRQLVALNSLSLASNQAVGNLDLASSNLSRLRTQWATLQGELQGVVHKLESSEEAASTIVQGVFTQSAISEWDSAVETANALANRKIEVEAKELALSGQPV